MKKFIFIIFCLMNIFGFTEGVGKINTKALIKAISQYELWSGRPEPTLAFDPNGNLWCIQSQPNHDFPIYDLEGNITSYCRDEQVLSIISPEGDAILTKKAIPELQWRIESRAIEFDRWGNGLFFCSYMHVGYIFMKVSPEGDVLWWKPETLVSWLISSYKIEDDTVYLISGCYDGKFRSTSDAVEIISFGDEEKRVTERCGFKYEKEPFGASLEMQKYLRSLAQKDISNGHLGKPLFITPGRRIVKINGLILSDGTPFRYGFWIVSRYIDYTHKVVRSGVTAIVDVKKTAFRKFKNATMPQLEVIQLPDKNYIVNFPVEEENAVYQVKLDSEGNVIEPNKLETAKAKHFDDLESGQRFVQLGYDPPTPHFRHVSIYFIGFDDGGMVYWAKYKIK